MQGSAYSGFVDVFLHDGSRSGYIKHEAECIQFDSGRAVQTFLDLNIEFPLLHGKCLLKDIFMQCNCWAIIQYFHH